MYREAGAVVDASTLTQNRPHRAAEARQHVFTEQLVGLFQDVFRSVRSVDSRKSAFRIDHPHQARTGIEPISNS